VGLALAGYLVLQVGLKGRNQGLLAAAVTGRVALESLSAPARPRRHPGDDRPLAPRPRPAGPARREIGPMLLYAGFALKLGVLSVYNEGAPARGGSLRARRLARQRDGQRRIVRESSRIVRISGHFPSDNARSVNSRWEGLSGRPEKGSRCAGESSGPARTPACARRRGARLPRGSHARPSTAVLGRDRCDVRRGSGHTLKRRGRARSPRLRRSPRGRHRGGPVGWVGHAPGGRGR